MDKKTEENIKNKVNEMKLNEEDLNNIVYVFGRYIQSLEAVDLDNNDWFVLFLIGKTLSKIGEYMDWKTK